MTTLVQSITKQVQALPETELDEFLSWFADFELAHLDEWDQQIQRDSQPGGRLETIMARVRRDPAAGRTKPLGPDYPSATIAEF